MVLAVDAMVGVIARADRERVVIVEHALQRSCGLEVDDAQIALAVLDAGSLAHRRARIDAESGGRSEEHTSEPQSLMRISYAVFCLKKKKVERNSLAERLNRRR